MQRPKSWLVLGILQICFGAWGILSGAMTLLVKPMLQAMTTLPGAGNDPAMKQQLAQLDAQTGLILVQGICQGLLGVLQIVAGILLIRFVRAARMTNFAYVALNVPSALIFAVIGYQTQMRMLAENPNQSGMEVIKAFGLATMVVTLLLILTYQALLVIFLRRDPFAAASADLTAMDGIHRDPGNPYQPPHG